MNSIKIKMKNEDFDIIENWDMTQIFNEKIKLDFVEYYDEIYLYNEPTDDVKRFGLFNSYRIKIINPITIMDENPCIIVQAVTRGDDEHPYVKNELRYEFLNDKLTLNMFVGSTAATMDKSLEEYDKLEAVYKYICGLAFRTVMYINYKMLSDRVEKNIPFKDNIQENKTENKTEKTEKKYYSLCEAIKYISKSHGGHHEIKCEKWSVRGHYRKYKNGKTIFIKEFTKGKKKDETIQIKQKIYMV